MSELEDSSEEMIQNAERQSIGKYEKLRDIEDS